MGKSLYYERQLFLFELHSITWWTCRRWFMDSGIAEHPKEV